jgi:hypothetical protein
MMTLTSRTLQVSIARPPAEVYDFAADPENLPKWARGLCRSIRRSEAGWIVDTAQGEINVRFTERNSLGVLDHYVTSAPGVEIYVPMRVVANGAGSEIIFTLFRQPGMSADKFAEDIGSVERDLETLKHVLEHT